MPKGNPWTTEQQRAAGIKGAAATKATYKRRREDPLYDVKRRLPQLFGDLLKAANGLPPYHDLSDKDRLGALLKAIEYGVGKPIGVDKQTPKDPSEGGGAEPAGTLAIE